MKSLDTNVIIRFLVNDDKNQGAKVKTLFLNAEKKGGTFFIASAVLLELLYVLDSVYELTRMEILKAIESMISMPILIFENTDAAQSLISAGRNSKIDLTDLLIGLISKEAGSETTITFDKKAAKSDLFELLI